MATSLPLFPVLSQAAAAEKLSSESPETFRVLRRSYMAIPVSRPHLIKIGRLGRGTKNALFENILEAKKLNNSGDIWRFGRYLRELEAAAIIKQAVIQALKGSTNHPTKNKGFQTMSRNTDRVTIDSRIRLT